MVLTAVSFLALSAPAWGQSDIGNDPSSFGNGIPDLIELFRARPPMGECPVGATDDHGPLPEASHLLHLGVPRFYRDYRRRLQLSADQVKALKTTQEAALAAWSSQQEKIDNLELQVWVLTGRRGDLYVFPAFSRVQPSRYVQDVIREEGERLWPLLEAGAHVYVCGDAGAMAPAVAAAFESILRDQGGLSRAKAGARRKEMVEHGKYNEDVWAT